MKTYLARLMFSIQLEDGSGKPEFDEQVRLIESVSLDGALYKARAIGKKEEETITDQHNRKIRWQFIDVRDLYLLETVNDGEQLYSTSLEVADPDSYISFIRNKSMEIQAKTLTFA
jgi:hypothetical protein